MKPKHIKCMEVIKDKEQEAGELKNSKKNDMKRVLQKLVTNPAFFFFSHKKHT